MAETVEPPTIDDSKTPVSSSENPERCWRCGAILDVGDTACRCCSSKLNDSEGRELLKKKAGAIREFFRGLVYFPKGCYTILSNRSLWTLSLIPFAINLVVLGLAFWLAYSLNDYLFKDLGPDMKAWEGFIWGILIKSLINIALIGLKFIEMLLVPLIVAWLFAVFGKFAFMPFMESLSEEVERLTLGDIAEQDFKLGKLSSDLIVGLFDALVLTLAQLLTFLILLPLHLIPLLGSLLWFLIPGCLFSSMDYTDMNFVRRRYSVREKLKIWSLYRYRFIGFGFAFIFLLGTPWLNIITGPFVVPAACVGGTLLFLELDQKSLVS